jgi:DNA-binding transcriptional ArsR family regulator
MSEQVTPDPTALRALSHPVRLRMLGLLRSEGPSTASRLAERLGLNSGATSYHLRKPRPARLRRRRPRARRLSAEDAMELKAALEALFESYAARETEDDTDDATQMVYQLHAFPRPGSIAPDVA